MSSPLLLLLLLYVQRRRGFKKVTGQKIAIFRQTCKFSTEFRHTAADL